MSSPMKGLSRMRARGTESRVRANWNLRNSPLLSEMMYLSLMASRPNMLFRWLRSLSCLSCRISISLSSSLYPIEARACS